MLPFLVVVDTAPVEGVRVLGPIDEEEVDLDGEDGEDECEGEEVEAQKAGLCGARGLEERIEAGAVEAEADHDHD